MSDVSKLRKKIIAITTLSLASAILTMLVAMNYYNFYRVGKDADNTLNILAKNGGKFKDLDNVPDGGIRKLNDTNAAPPGDDIDIQHSTRYFTFKFDENGNSSEVMFKISYFTFDEANNIATRIHSGSSTRGWAEGYYRYYSYSYNDEDYVTVMDQTRELVPMYRVLGTSALAGTLFVIVIFLFLIPVSKLIVKPIEDNLAKQKRFISDASHELKTPLSIISLNNDLETVEKGESENTANISRQVNLMNKMVKSLNELAKMDEQQETVFTDFDMSTLANEMVSSFVGVTDQFEKKLSYSIDDGINFNGNKDKIRRLFSILLDNAVKYSKTYINFNLHLINKKIVLTVNNDSDNLPKEDIDNVFERFYRSPEARSSSISGSGLGLSMAKEITTAHKGKISASSDNGVFEIRAEF